MIGVTGVRQQRLCQYSKEIGLGWCTVLFIYFSLACCHSCSLTPSLAMVSFPVVVQFREMIVSASPSSHHHSSAIAFKEQNPSVQVLEDGHLSHAINSKGVLLCIKYDFETEVMWHSPSYLFADSRSTLSIYLNVTFKKMYYIIGHCDFLNSIEI